MITNDLNETNNLHNFLYLFIMDTLRIPFHNYPTYEQGEPGFARPFLKAYIAAFQEPQDGRLSHDLLQRINAIALMHLPNSQAGVYRDITGNFLIGIEEYEGNVSPLYSASAEGFQEFINYWFINHPHRHHALSFEWRAEPLSNDFALAARDGQLLWMTIKNRKARIVPFDAATHLPLIQSLSKDYNYGCYINTMAYEPNPLQLTEQLMQTIFEEFHAEMAAVDLDHDKIRIIAKHVQRIEQLHPFQDGNVRTCSILINKLLNDHHLPLTILSNPNKLDCCSLEEVVGMIWDGQTVYRQLLANTDPRKLIIQTRENHPAVQHIVCPPNNLNEPELLKMFCEVVLHMAPPTNNYSQRLFDFPQQALVNRLKGTIKADLQANRTGKCSLIEKSIEKRNFAVALKQACAAGEYNIINKILTYRDGLKIDVNQPSTTGETALDWFDRHTVTMPELAAQTRASLCEAGAINAVQLTGSVATDLLNH